MKLSKSPNSIVGLRVGEVAIDLTSPSRTTLTAKFFLLRDPELGENINAGQFSKTQWSDAAIQAFQQFIDMLEDDAMQDLFGEVGGDGTTKQQDTGLKFPSVPILGGSK